MKVFVSLSAKTPIKPDGKQFTPLKKAIEKYGSEFEVAYNKISKREAILWLKFFDHQYHSLNKSKVSDEVYDILYDFVADRWPKSKYIIKKNVGSKVVVPEVHKGKGRTEVKLPVFMGSQDKLKPGSSKLAKFSMGKSFVIGDKLDGISLLLEYEDGYPVACYTRGDGTKGQDVSGVIPALQIPKKIKTKGMFYVRCEFIIKGKKFAAKHSKHEGTGEFKTARNMGGGLLTRNTPSDKVADFDVVAYEIPKGKGAGQKLSSQLALLKAEGFTVVRSKKVTAIDEEKLVELHNNFKKVSKYEIDGIIVTQDTSYTATKKNPTHAMAFKINSLDSAKVVKIIDIEWNKSRHGKFIPRVIVDPVMLGGVEVQHFTGHNYYYIQHGFTYKDRDKKLPVRPIGIGSEIRVIRSGDVIPYIMEVVKPSRKPSKPAEDFKLGLNDVHAMVVEKKGKVNTTSHKKTIQHFFSANAIDADGMKSGTIKKLYENGYNTLKKVLKITVPEVLAMEGFQERSAIALVQNIKNAIAKNSTFSRLSYGSSIFGDKIGSKKMQAIIDMYPDIMTMTKKLTTDELAEALRNVDTISGTANIIAEKLPAFAAFLEDHNLKLAKEENSSVKVTSSKLEGVKVVMTGLRDKDLSAAIKAAGGKESGANTADVLITKVDYSNKKTDIAEERGIPVYTVEEFRQKYGI